MQWRADVPEDIAALSAALGLGRDEAGEFDETYYEDGYEASLDDDAHADGALEHGDASDDQDDHPKDDHA
jgi:23S rRNA pseudouridine1911/1915/1917 synthase